MWKISNILSLSRIILTIPTVYFLMIDSYTYALVVGTIAGLTDFFDGYTARKLHEISETGKILDPLADKIFIAGIALVLLVKDLIPLWFVAIVLTRDIAILIAGLIMKRKSKEVPSSNWVGKITFGAIVIAVLLSVLKIDILTGISYLIAAVGIVISSFIYFKRLSKII